MKRYIPSVNTSVVSAYQWFPSVETSDVIVRNGTYFLQDEAGMLRQIFNGQYIVRDFEGHISVMSEPDFAYRYRLMDA